MRGGIQKGTTAFDTESKRLDHQLKQALKELSQEFPQFEAKTMLKADDKKRLLGEDCFGFAPDGGVWFLNGKMVACFEAKKQGNGGNAQERWYDNATTAKFVNPDIKYLTFCSGEGTKAGGPLDKLSRKAKIVMGEGFVFKLSENGFEFEEVKAEMRTILNNLLK